MKEAKPAVFAKGRSAKADLHGLQTVVETELRGIRLVETTS